MRTAQLLLVVSTILLYSVTRSDGKSAVEKTLAMIKPDGLRASHSDAIKKMIQSDGFEIVAEKVSLFDVPKAESFYAEHSQRSFFPELVQFMTSGPVLALVLEKQNAIKEWRVLMGPTDSNKARREAPNSVRAKFGLDGQSNCVHGSDSPEAAVREMAFFFVSDGSLPEETSKAKIVNHDEL